MNNIKIIFVNIIKGKLTQPLPIYFGRGKSGHSRAMCHVKTWVQQGKPAVTDQYHRK